MGDLMDETGGRIDVERCPYDEKDLRRFGNLSGFEHSRDLFAEPDHVWTELLSVFAQIPNGNIPVLQRIETIRIHLTPSEHQFSVQVENVTRSRSFMEIINVLGDDRDIVVALQFG